MYNEIERNKRKRHRTHSMYESISSSITFDENGERQHLFKE